jgi:hypothetical protein
LRKPANFNHLERLVSLWTALSFQFSNLRKETWVNEKEYQYLNALVCLQARAQSNEPQVAGRKMRAGMICSSCKSPLPAPHTPNRKQCQFCVDKHLVFMCFRRCFGWQCGFRTQARKKLPREFTLKSPDTLREIARRGNCVTDKWDREGFELGLEVGRGGIWLRLNDEQYLALGGVL